MRVSVVKKKPTEKFAVGFKYSTVDLAADATISNVSVAITDAEGEAVTDPNDLAIVGSPAKDDYTVSAMLEKGIDGSEYYVVFTTTTSAGQVFVDKIFVKVRV